MRRLKVVSEPRAAANKTVFLVTYGEIAMFTAVSKLHFLGLFAFMTASLLAVASSDAQPPGKKGKGPKGPPPGAEILTVRGTVKDFTSAPKGEVDGVTLTDGTWVHWPPHLSDRFSGIVGKGDKVKVIGWMETGPKGDTKLEVSSLTNLNTNQTRETDRFTPAVIEAGARFGPGTGEVITANGAIKEFTSAPKGEVDGFVLSDGRWVHWPPHLSERFTSAVVKGDKVRVTGFWETGKKGDTKLEVSILTNLRTNKTIENPDRPLPAGVVGKTGNREAQIRALEDQLEQIQRELQRLRKEK
jgi:hypothetical protein